MTNAWDSRKKAQEDEYFKRKEQEDLEKMRHKLDAEKAETERAASRIGCPKCDGTLGEVEVEAVKIDRCDKCGGVWLDAGELETLTTHEQHGSFFGRMFKK